MGRRSVNKDNPRYQQLEYDNAISHSFSPRLVYHNTDLDCDALHELYKQNTLAQKIVDFVPSKATEHQEMSELEKQLFSEYTKHARINGQAFLLRDINNKLIVTTDCDYHCEGCLTDHYLNYKGYTYRYGAYLVLNDGLLKSVKPLLEAYLSSIQATKNMVIEQNLFVLGVEGLFELATNTKTSLAIKNRLRDINRSKTVNGAVALDKSIETVENLTRSLAGVDSLIDKQIEALVAMTKLPKTFLFGSTESTALSSSGSTDLTLLELEVRSYRENVLNPFMAFVRKTAWHYVESHVIPINEKEQAEYKLLEGNYVIALFQAGLITQSTAQEMLKVPIEKIEPTGIKQKQNAISNTFTSDLTDKKQ